MDGHWKAYFELNGKSIEETKDFILQLSTGASRYAWYYHPNGRHGKGPHIHGWLYDWPKTAETLRNKAKAFFNLTEAKQFGVSNKYHKGTIMSETSFWGYIGYMSKGKFDSFCYYGISKESLDARKEIALAMYPPADESESSRETLKQTGKVDRKTEYDYQLEAEELLWNADNGYANVSKEDIYDAVVKVLDKHKRLAHYRRVANLCQAIRARLHPADAKCVVLKMF